jgi:Protein of unknown function (DUF4239)
MSIAARASTSAAASLADRFKAERRLANNLRQEVHATNCELLRPYLPVLKAQDMGRMRDNQTMLSNLQDMDVLLADVRSAVADKEMSGHAVGHLRQELLRRWRELIAIHLAAADRLFEFEPNSLAASARRPLLRHGGARRQTPTHDAQRAFNTQAAAITADLGQLRWLLFEPADPTASKPFLIVLIAWLAFIFVSVGLFAPSNSTVVTSLMLAGLSVSAAIFLILELDQPFSGLLQISSRPMRNVFTHLAQ